MRRALCVLALAVGACSRAAQTDARPAAPDAAAHAATHPAATTPAAASLSLPDRIATFDAGPLVPGDGFVRRTYSRASAHVTVTLAHLDLGPGGYDRWLAQSTADYAQATLDLPSGAGNGFYQCADALMVRCSLLIQLRNGTHLEIRGDEGTSRADADAVAAGLRLGEL